jgi:hypothetical protein
VWIWDGRKAERSGAVIKPVGERWVLVEDIAEGAVFLDADLGAAAGRLKPGREVRADMVR